MADSGVLKDQDVPGLGIKMKLGRTSNRGRSRTSTKLHKEGDLIPIPLGSPQLSLRDLLSLYWASARARGDLSPVSA